MMDSLVGLDEVAVLEEIDLVNEMDQDGSTIDQNRKWSSNQKRNRLMSEN